MPVFGATNEPGTCLWCGRKLRHRFITKKEVVDEKPKQCKGIMYNDFGDKLDERCGSKNIYLDDRNKFWRCEEHNHYVERRRRIVSREQYTTTPGYGQSGVFCTLGCGFRFGLAFAQIGRRLQPTDKNKKSEESE